jgi:hypothetical protein
MRRFAPIEMRELTDRHRPKRLIAVGEIRIGETRVREDLGIQARGLLLVSGETKERPLGA